MKIRDDMVIREKAGYIFGYDSIVSILPEMKLGKLYNPHTVFDCACNATVYGLNYMSLKLLHS